MIEYRILTLSEDTVIPDDGPSYQVPRVPGAYEVDPQTPGLFTCKGEKVRGINTRWTFENYATPIHITGNQYIVFADDFTEIDPLNKGLKIKDVKWPWKVIERAYDDEGELVSETVTDTPTIPTEIGGSGMTAMIQKETLKTEAIPP